jgi:hypothetical protein
MTNKKRIQHYKNALKMLRKEKYSGSFPFFSSNLWFLNNSGICELLSLSAYGELEDLKKGDFPEFELFKPTKKQLIKEQKENNIEISPFWWPKENRSVREIALLLCIEMAKDNI